MRFGRLAQVIATGVLALGLAGAAEAGDKLRIGVEGAYPPFSWKEADGTLKGFDIEIAWALCDKMGRDCELVEQDWDGMIPALMAKKFDAIIASMSITEERMKRVDFTRKYYRTPAKFVARKDAKFEPTPEGLKGKAIGVQRGTTHQCFLDKFFGESDVKLYGTQEEVFLDLGSGRLDAQLSDAPQSLEGFLSKPEGKDYAFLGGVQFDLPCHGEGAGIALRKGSDDLRKAFDTAVQAIRKDGTYKKINDKYFDFDVYGDATPAS